MASRENAFVEITPEVLLKAYACGIFPMAESADDPALYWIEPERRGGVFLKLLEAKTFSAVTINSDFGCVEWPGGIDLCPDTMHQAMTGSEAESKLHSRTALREGAKKK